MRRSHHFSLLMLISLLILVPGVYAQPFQKSSQAASTSPPPRAYTQDESSKRQSGTMDGDDAQSSTPSPAADASSVTVPTVISPAIPSLPSALAERQARAAAQVKISDAWARPAQSGASSALYFVLHGGKAEDTLLGVSSAWATNMMMHQTTTDPTGVARMVMLDKISVGPGKNLAFAPGGYHVMLMGLTRQLRLGQSFPVVFRFAQAGDVRVMVQVRQAAESRTGGFILPMHGSSPMIIRKSAETGNMALPSSVSQEKAASTSPTPPAGQKN